VGLAAVLCRWSSDGDRRRRPLSFFPRALWAYYHLVKQHYGFMVLYQKENGDLAAVDNASGSCAATVRFSLSVRCLYRGDPQARSASHACCKAALATGNSTAGDHDHFSVVWRRVSATRNHRQPLNVPKYLLLAPRLDALVVAPDADAQQANRIVAILTIYHTCSNHRLILVS